MGKSVPSIRLAADIGGTFTDVVLDTGKQLHTAKVPTNISDPEIGILNGVKVVLDDAGLQPSDVDEFIHGTTLATNALIERKGVKTALITTQGFRDSIEIAYESRYDQFDLMIDKPAQLIPRDLRYTVTERVSVNGDVLIDLDERQIPLLYDQLCHEQVEAIAIGFLHSYSNPAHERRVRELLISNGCKAEISISSEVCPEIREFERLMTTACNAYVQPIMARYLRSLYQAFCDNGFDCSIFLMTSGGGMTTLENAIRFPIRLVESGPSGGAVLAAKIAKDLGEEKILAFDMGGTTAKISIIEDYKPKTARNFEIARSARLQKGSGMPVRIPVIEMIEIGAGGGSIARVDSLGRLNIGPESAGANPGPACYSKGGERPAVTDANLTLGRIDPDAFAEGKMPLDADAAHTAIEQHVSRPMNISIQEGALGITEMVDENMSNAARIHAVEHGVDLSEFSMIAFGGGGPLHAVRLAEKLGMKRVIIPANSSVGSALGFLNAPVSYEVVQSQYMTLSAFNPKAANAQVKAISTEAHAIVGQGVGKAKKNEYRSVYMRYVGQGHEIQVPLPDRELIASDADEIRASYDACYRQLYGRTIPDRDIEILSWSCVVSSEANGVTPQLSSVQNVSTGSPGVRRVVDTGSKVSIDFETHWRPKLPSGIKITGPALVEEPQTTTLLTSGFVGKLDDQHNLILDRIA